MSMRTHEDPTVQMPPVLGPGGLSRLLLLLRDDGGTGRQ